MDRLVVSTSRSTVSAPSIMSKSYLAHSLSTSSFLSTVAEQPEGLPPTGLVLVSAGHARFAINALDDPGSLAVGRPLRQHCLELAR